MYALINSKWFYVSKLDNGRIAVSGAAREAVKWAEKDDADMMKKHYKLHDFKVVKVK